MCPCPRQNSTLTPYEIFCCIVVEGGEDAIAPETPDIETSCARSITIVLMLLLVATVVSTYASRRRQRMEGLPRTSEEVKAAEKRRRSQQVREALIIVKYQNDNDESKEMTMESDVENQANLDTKACLHTTAGTGSCNTGGVLPNGVGETKCSICLSDYKIGDEIAIAKCDHFTHADCLKLWLAEHNGCPMCRVIIVPT